MPHPKGHIKLTGDTHLPDAESELELEEGRTGLEALAHERGGGRRGGVRKAGMLQESEAPVAYVPVVQSLPQERALPSFHARDDDATWRTAARVGLVFLGLYFFLRMLRR
jgi:hypothetical protein